MPEWAAGKHNRIAEIAEDKAALEAEKEQQREADGR